jgi:hypothetical protein
MVEASSQRPGGTRRVEPLLLALSLLTLVTGLVDAACYLGLGRVFTANMTGNVVLLAFGAAGAQGLPVLAPTVSLVVFLVGATGGGGGPAAWSGRPAPRCRRRCGAAGSCSCSWGSSCWWRWRRWWRWACRSVVVALGGMW